MQRDSALSPWSLKKYKQVDISPINHPIAAQVVVPGSKSFTNRALIIAALAKGQTVLKGTLKSDDSYWCIDALKRLGVNIQVNEVESSVVIEGSEGRWPNQSGELFIGASGTISRFLPGALALAEAGEWKLDGIEQLRKRPVDPLLDALEALGAEFKLLTGHKGLPYIVKGRGLAGGRITIPGNVSSQYLSGLLMAAPYAKKSVEIEVVGGLVQPAYVQMTINLMKEFGIRVDHSKDFRTFKVEQGVYRARELTLEADASTACYFFSLAALTGGEVTVRNVYPNSLQPDKEFVQILAQMGCEITEDPEQGITVIGPKQLKGHLELDLKPMSDQAVTIAALAPFADGPIRVFNVEHIRQHESDRIAVICDALKRLGTRVEEAQDGFTIYPGIGNRKVSLDPHDDHRQAMTFSLLAMKHGRTTILEPHCVSKTCPNFFELLKACGIEATFS